MIVRLVLHSHNVQFDILRDFPQTPYIGLIIVYFTIYSLYNNHFKFHVSYLGMNYNNVIGFISISTFVLQVLSGLFSSIYYDDFYMIAFDPIVYIMHDVNIGRFIRLSHCLGATLFMFFMFIHLIRGA